MNDIEANFVGPARVTRYTEQGPSAFVPNMQQCSS